MKYQKHYTMQTTQSFTIKQISDFCINRYLDSPDKLKYHLLDNGNKICPAYIAGDFIFQHAIEDASKNILFEVTSEIINWLNKCLPQEPKTDFLFPANHIKQHYITQVGIYVSEDIGYISEVDHKIIYATNKLYRKFLKIC